MQYTRLDTVINDLLINTGDMLQAHYLTGRGSALDLSILSSVTGLFAFLHALPASQLTSRRLGEINSVLLQHLVNNLPADNLPRTLSLVHKIASSIGKRHNIAMLYSTVEGSGGSTDEWWGGGGDFQNVLYPSPIGYEYTLNIKK